MPTDPPVQTWELRVEGRAHRVEVRGSVTRRIEWWVDGDLVLEKRTAEDKPLLAAPDRPELGLLALHFGRLGGPRRATVRPQGQLAGVDLEPEAGSPAAAYEERVRAHPVRYAVLQGAGGVLAVGLPILLAALAARFAFSLDIPWPDIPWPDIPWPDIPWPDLPSVPLPDLPDLSLPGWLRTVLDNAAFVWPVVLAVVLARAEIRRRRTQDELRAKAREDETPDED